MFFSLPAERVTSAGLYDAQGRLLRTLWSAERFPAGNHVRAFEAGVPAGTGVQVALIHHNVQPRWEGVIGNTSAAFVGPGVHRAFHAPSSLAIAADRVYYAGGYNEGQRTLHGFDRRDPQRELRPFEHIDPFVALSMIATDGRRVYAANTGGLSRTSFVMAFDIERRSRYEWPRGQARCLNRRNDTQCYEAQDYRGVIDVATDAADLPTGLAVQTDGPLLAVARGQRQRVQLFDKTSGQRVGEFPVRLDPQGSNQLAFASNGDLWVVSGSTVLRYTRLLTAPRLAATIAGLVAPLAVALQPGNDDAVWVADGGASQQLKRFDREGRARGQLGQASGYGSDPAVSFDKLCFLLKGNKEQTALAVESDGSLWVVDTCNNRMLHWRADGSLAAQVAYLPAFYASTADPNDARRVFANFLEFRVEPQLALVPGGSSWTLVRNWLPGLPASLRDAEAENRGFAGFRTVTTLANGRSYGVIAASGRDIIVELPARAPLRAVRALAPPGAGTTAKVLYENGDLGWALVGGGTQRVLRQRLAGFDAVGDPLWTAEPDLLATVPLRPDSPHDRGAFSGPTGPRFPLTAGDRVVFFDPSVVGNEGFHLGAVQRGARDWLWMASPSAPMDGRGSFQTRQADRSLRAADRGIQYGGNMVHARERHIVFGFHGEFFTDQSNGRVGQANQFMHFHDSGLFVAQFGVPSTRATMEAQAGLAGNAFSWTLVSTGGRLFLYHNDEWSHGGVHRWRIDGWQDLREMKGSGLSGAAIVLR